MNKTVLASLLAVAGAAASVQAQNAFTIEVQLVVDGQADAPTGAGIDTFLPGPQATRVGLTLQARVRQNTAITTSGSGNYGIGTYTNPSTVNPAKFTHNDTTFSGGTYQPFGRGRVGTTLGADGLPQAGVFGAEGGRNFRTVISGGLADQNGLQTNEATANGLNGPSANGYFPPTGAEVRYIQGGVPNLGTGLGTAPLFPVGQFSGWYNLYRIYFDPKPNASDPIRNVTVTAFGRFQAVHRFQILFDTPQYTIGTATGATLETSATATFQVPTPGAAALLGLGGLIAARRRRAA